MEKGCVCLLCSLGCGLRIRVENGVAEGVEFDVSSPVNQGRLCARAHCTTELLNTPRRLSAPLTRADGSYREVSWREAMSTLAERFRQVRARYGPGSLAVVMDANHTNEEVHAARWMAQHVLGTDNFACRLLPGDRGLLEGLAQGHTQILKTEGLENVSCVLSVGSPLDRAPVLAKRLLDARYARRENQLLVVDPLETTTTQFADMHLRNRPGSEALVLAGMLKASIEDGPALPERELASFLKCLSNEAIADATGVPAQAMAWAGRNFANAEKAAIILAPRLGQAQAMPVVVGLARLLCRAAKGGTGVLPLFATGNAVGSFQVAGQDASKALPEMLQGAWEGRIKAMLVLGEGALSSCPADRVGRALERLAFLAVSSAFVPAIERTADMLLPSALWLENKGTVTFWDSRNAGLEPVLPPPGTALSDLEMIGCLAGAMGAALDTSTPSPDQGGAPSPGATPPLKVLADGLDEMLAKGLILRLEKGRERRFTLAGMESPVHSAYGSFTQASTWARRTLPAPFIEVSEGDAEGLGIPHGEPVQVVSRHGRAILPLHTSNRVPTGVVAVPTCFPQTAGLFGWRGTPEQVELVPAPEAARISAEGAHG